MIYRPLTCVLSFCLLKHSKIAPANAQRQQELDEEKEKVAAMRMYRKKIYETQKRIVSELVEIISIVPSPLSLPVFEYIKMELM